MPAEPDYSDIRGRAPRERARRRDRARRTASDDGWRCRMKLGLLTAALPRRCRSRRSPAGRRQRASRCSRSPAGRRPRAASGGVTPASPTSTSRTSTPARVRPTMPRTPRPGDLVAGLLPEQPRTPTTPSASEANAPPAQGDRRRRARSACRRSARSSAATRTLPLPENLERLPARSGRRSSTYAERAGREDRHRELPDDLQLGRVAGRHEHRLLARRSGTRCSRPSRRSNFGLNLDPSHLVWLHDRLRARGLRLRVAHHPRARARTWRSDRDGLYRHGHVRRWASAGRCRGCPGSARSSGIASSRRCTRSATTAWSRSSTRTAASRPPRSSSNGASSSRETSCGRCSSSRRGSGRAARRRCYTR